MNGHCVSSTNKTVMNQPNADVHTPCSQEEAAHAMLLHVSHAAHHGNHQMLIRTVNTDVVVLAVFAIYQLPAGCELWQTFGMTRPFVNW